MGQVASVAGVVVMGQGDWVAHSVGGGQVTVAGVDEMGQGG